MLLPVEGEPSLDRISVHPDEHANPVLISVLLYCLLLPEFDFLLNFVLTHISLLHVVLDVRNLVSEVQFEVLRHQTPSYHHARLLGHWRVEVVDLLLGPRFLSGQFEHQFFTQTSILLISTLLSN